MLNRFVKIKYNIDELKFKLVINVSFCRNVNTVSPRRTHLNVC